MKKLKFNWLVGAMLLLALALAACGGSAPVDDGGDEEPAVEEPAAEAEEEMEEEMPEVVEELECSDALGCVEVDAGDAINMAYMIVTSGPVAFLGEDQVGGIEIAIDDRGGMLLGHELELTGEDALCSAEGGQTAAQKIAADDTVVGVIGTACSSAATAGLPIISEAGLSMISASNTAPTLTDDDQAAGGVWQPGYYRTAHNDLFQGRVAAEFAYNELGARTLATIHDGSPYADGLQAVMANVFIELGGEVTFQGAVNVGDTDMRPILTEIASSAPDLLYFPVFEPEAPLIVAQSVEIAGLEDTILFGADAALVESFPENAGAPAEGMYLSGPYVVPEGPYGDLLAKWDAKFGGAPPSGFHGHAYDAANLMMDAIEAAAQMDADGNLLIGRQAIRDYLSGVSGYDGVIGKLSCNATGDCATGEALAVFQVTADAINDDAWPLSPIYTPAGGSTEAAMDDGEMMDAGDVKVCQVTDVGGIDDKSFNATAWAGAERAAADMGIEVKFLESQQQTDYDKNISAFIDDGCDLIISVGFLMGDATAAAAEANPDQQFAIIDVDYLDFPNLQGIGFAIDQAGFLAGYTAANASETGVIGTFGGINIPPVTAFMDGYVMGANYYNAQNGADVQVLGWDIDTQDGLFTGNFESTDDGRAFGESLMDEGADVIMPVAGPVGLGTAAAIQERGNAWIVGVDTDWTVSAPEFADIVLTSVLKRLDTAVYSASEATVKGTFEGGLWIGDLANDGVGISDPAVAVDGLDAIIDGIIAGSIPTHPGQEAMMDDGDGEMMAEASCEVDLSGESIVLYQQAGREGPLAALLGQGFAFATEDALEWVNANGGICGAELEVVFTETNYDTEKEVAAFESSVASDPRPFLVFTYASGATVALKDRVVEEQIVNFAAGLNGPATYDPANGYTIAMAPIYSDQFAGYAEYLQDNWDTLKPEGAGDDIVIGVVGWANSYGAGATTPESLAYVESLGITVLPLEEIALSPDADASGPVQNLLLGGANVIWNQSLSFTVAQVIGTVHALGQWDNVVVSGVNWSMHNDVPNFLGDNQALMDGYCGPHPYATWNDTDVPGVALAIEMFEAAGRPDEDKSTTYLTTFGQIMGVREALISTVNKTGSADITGEQFLNSMIEDGGASGMGIASYEVGEIQRGSREIQVGCWSADADGNLSFDIVSDTFQAPDTAPYPEN